MRSACEGWGGRTFFQIHNLSAADRRSEGMIEPASGREGFLNRLCDLQIPSKSHRSHNLHRAMPEIPERVTAIFIRGNVQSAAIFVGGKVVNEWEELVPHCAEWRQLVHQTASTL